jgi:membrane protein DedA with SNARE-associated domain
MLELFVGKIEYLQPIIVVLGLWSYLLIMLLSALESAPVLGTFTPGTLVLLFYGLLASQGQLNILPIILFATLGGVLGDTCGYFLGKYGRRFVREHKGLLQKGHLDIGQVYFSKHGGKSVFAGRFIGPIRPIIPMVAGMVEMNFKKFFFLNITSAFLWAFLYVNLGFIFGNQIEFIDSIISKLGLVASIIIVSVAGYYFHKYRKKSLSV